MPRHLKAIGDAAPEAASPDSPSARLRRAYNCDDRLDAIAAIEALRADLDEQQLHLVIEARRRRTTWGEIGGALGTSRQGAFNRFGGLIQRYEPGSSTPLPMSATW